MNSGNPLAQLLNYLRYKGKDKGVKIALINEAYTSQTCPKCGHRHKPSGRIYRCTNSECDFVGIRDIVGAANILNKYLNEAMKPNGVLVPVKAKYRRPVKLRPPVTRLDCVVPMITGKWLDNTTQTAQALSSAEGNTSSTLSDVA